MTVEYQILFSVELLHDYYSSKLCRDFEIVPSAQTVKLLKDKGLIWKAVGSELIIAVNTNAVSGQPVVSLAAADHFSFYLKLNNANFNNITNLERTRSKIFYYSNLSGNESAASLYLHLPVAEYNAAATYLPGALAADNQDKVYRALKGNKPGNVHAVTEASFWEPAVKLYDAEQTYFVNDYAANAVGEVFIALRPNDKNNKHALDQATFWSPIGKIQYTTTVDQLTISPALYHLNTSAADTVDIDIFGLNIATGEYDIAVADTKHLSFDDAQTVVQVELDGLPAGRYKVKANDDSEEIYMDNIAAYENVFGVIEIFNHLPDDNNFALFDAGNLKSPRFLIHFDSRAAIWKYIARTADVTAVKDSSEAFSFGSVTAKEFTSNVPIPFSERSAGNIFIQSTALGDIKPVASPGINRLSKIVQAGDTYYCAETYLNY